MRVSADRRGYAQGGFFTEKRAGNTAFCRGGRSNPLQPDDWAPHDKIINKTLCDRRDCPSAGKQEKWVYGGRQRMDLPSFHRSGDWISCYRSTRRSMPMARANARAAGYSEVSQNLGRHVRSHPRHVVVNRMRRGDLRLWSENAAVLASPQQK